jgi:hypothetical protein
MRGTLLALCVAFAAAMMPPLCLNGIWLEVPFGEVEEGKTMPHVMCGRTPACVVHTHLSRARCASRPNDEDWPGGVGATQSGAVGQLLYELRNKTLVLIGDSITEGIIDWLECDSHRESIRSVRLDDTERGIGRGRIDLHVHQLREPEMRARAAQFWEAWFQAHWGAEGPPLPMDTRVLAFPETRTLLVFTKVHRLVESRIAALLTLGDVFVVNYGLHYDTTNHTAYAVDMRRLAALAAGRRVLFRETSAQHFPGTGAYATWEQAHTGGTPCVCAPSTEESEARNAVRRFNAIARSEFKEIIPWYDYTNQQHELHEEDYCAYETPLKREQGCCDCSHYCYTPQMSTYATAALLQQVRARLP